MRRLALLLAASLALGAGGDDAQKPRVYKPSNVRDMEELAMLLKHRVAYLELMVHAKPGELLLDPKRDGFAAVIGPQRVAAPSFLFEDVDSISVVGPKGRLVGRLVLLVPELRVALVDVEAPLARIGLEPSPKAPPESRALDQNVFALISTLAEADVQMGTVTDDGSAEELEGHVRTTLRLSAGMPVFDDHARLLGIARTAAWDHEKTLIFTPEHIEKAKTSTQVVPAPKKAPTPEGPWWLAPPKKPSP